jgi:hypothetical protein
MRSRIALAALLTTLTACALPQGTGTPYAADYRPLTAYISGPDFGGLGFQLNRPAHVAMFEVVPHRGASLVFPYAGSGGMSGYVTSGRFDLGTRRIASRDLYNASFARNGMSGPTFYLLVASEQPLNLDRFGTFGMGIRTVLGHEYASGSPYRMMERLAEAALPVSEQDGSWTTDLYVHWPEAISRTPADRHVLLTCNGYSVYVRLEYLAQLRQTLCATQAESPVSPNDTTEAREGQVAPGRRPPPVDQSALSEQVRTSAQMEEPATRERRTPQRGTRAGAPEMEREDARVRSGESRPATGRRGQSPTQPGKRAGSSDPAPAPPAARPAPESQPRSGAQRAPRAEPRSAPASPQPSAPPQRCADC